MGQDMKEKRKPGRPRGSCEGPQKTEMIALRCTIAERKKAELIGNGNASKGLRIALRECEMTEFDVLEKTDAA